MTGRSTGKRLLFRLYLPPSSVFQSFLRAPVVKIDCPMSAMTRDGGAHPINLLNSITSITAGILASYAPSTQ